MDRDVHRPPRSALLAKAEQIRDQPDRQRAFGVRLIIEAGLPHEMGEDRLISEAEVFERAYGDHGGQYWTYVLWSTMPLSEFCETLALHAVERAPKLLESGEAIRVRLVLDAAADGQLTGTPSLISEVAGELWVDPAAATRWLFSQPAHRHVVPASLIRAIEPVQLRPAMEQPPAAAVKRGRKPHPAWDDIWIEIVRRADLGELPVSNQEELIQSLQTWLTERGVEPPGRTAMQERISKLYETLDRK